MIRVDKNLDPVTLRRTFGCFPSGVTAVCGAVDDELIGMAVSAFSSVSLEPPLAAICISNTSRTWPRLRSAELIGVSVLNEMQAAVGRQLSRSGDRFAGVPWDRSSAGAVLIQGAAAWLECAVSFEIPAGDHRIVVLRICASQANTQIAPLVHHSSRFRGLAEERAAESADGSRLLDRIAQIIAASTY